MQEDNNRQTMLRHYNKIFLHISVPIFCGTAIYAFWRGLHFIDPTEKIFPLFSPTHVLDWIKYNLPDGLWFYALLSALLFIWKDKFSVHFVSWLLLAIILSFLSEALQAYNFLSGTFDWKDLFAYSGATIFFFLNFQHSSIYHSHFTFKITTE